MREHRGNLDLAVQCFGRRLKDWVDLSTGINRQPYPVRKIEFSAQRASASSPSTSR